MNNCTVILDSWTYWLTLGIFLLTGIGMFWQGLIISRLKDKVKLFPAGLRLTEKAIIDMIVMRTGNSHNTLVAHLRGLRGAIKEVKKETQEIKTRQHWSRERELKTMTMVHTSPVKFSTKKKRS